MRIVPLAALLAALSLAGCAGRTPSSAIPPSPAASIAGKAGESFGESHRFSMIQDGRAMRADDFDAWMKARGIRVAKGAQVAHGIESAPADARDAR